MPTVKNVEKSAQLFDNVRKYFDIDAVCTNGVDMIGLKRGTPAFELLMKREKELVERVKAHAVEGKHNFQLLAAEGKHPMQLLAGTNFCRRQALLPVPCC
jgi:hypothetical protein